VNAIVASPLHYTTSTFTFTKPILYFSMSAHRSLPSIPTGDTDDDISDAGAIVQLHTQAEEFISSLGQQWNLPRGITNAPSSSTDEELLVHYATPTPKPMSSSSKDKTPASKSQTPAPSLAELAKL